MAVLDREELQASPLADLHVIAGQLGVEGFRRLRKAELIDAILSHQNGAGEEKSSRPGRTRRPRTTRSRSAKEPAGEPEEQDGKAPSAARRKRGRAAEPEAQENERSAEGVVEILGNGSAFVRINHPDSSDGDVYVSAAQVRRCELVSGDRVSGPVRMPRRSERYPSLVRIETINGQSADTVAEGTRYEELPIAWPSERIAFDSQDATLQAIEWLTPIGLGSRVAIVGPAHSGKSETLRRVAAALGDREGVESMLVLCGARPEEIDEWGEGPLKPAVALDFAASADAQGQAVEGVVETAKRLAARGGNAIVLIDGLDGLHPHTARRILAAARNLREAGSLTILATASRPFGGETTVVALDAANASTGRFPALDLLGSGTLRAELLVGADGAEAIVRARAAAAEG